LIETSEHQKCERIKHIPTKKEFFENYLSKSKPVIIEGANSHWESLKKWTNEYLRFFSFFFNFSFLFFLF